MSDPGVPAGPSAHELEQLHQQIHAIADLTARSRIYGPADALRETIARAVTMSEAVLAAAVRPSEGWQTAALLEERTRQAIRDRQQAGESIPALAEDYGVPEAFVVALGAWQFGRPSERPEICICAAIKFTSADAGPLRELIARGHRHDSCFATAAKWFPPPDPTTAVQGFITSRNRFVDRAEAATLQSAAGIVSTHTGKLPAEMLFSEDLYLLENDPAVGGASPEPPAARRETR